MGKSYLGLAGAISIYCALGVLPASAADVQTAEPASSWTGFYVGGGGGYRWADFDVDTLSCDGVVCNTESDDGVFAGYAGTFEEYGTNLDDNGFFGTVQAGFDWEFTPGFLVGIMGDADIGEKLKDSEFNQVNYGGVDPDSGQAWSADMNEVFTLSARAGFTPTDSLLLYGLVGYSFGDARASYFEGCDFSGDGGDCSDISASSKKSLDGWTFGGGAEMKLTDNISGRIEYRYTDLGSIDVSGENGTFTGDTSTDVIVQSIRATINFRL
jgi:outer membrane immunogenic protein